MINIGYIMENAQKRVEELISSGKEINLNIIGIKGEKIVGGDMNEFEFFLRMAGYDYMSAMLAKYLHENDFVIVFMKAKKIMVPMRDTMERIVQKDFCDEQEADNVVVTIYFPNGCYSMAAEVSDNRIGPWSVAEPIVHLNNETVCSQEIPKFDFNNVAPEDFPGMA